MGQVPRILSGQWWHDAQQNHSNNNYLQKDKFKNNYYFYTYITVVLIFMVIKYKIYLIYLCI